MNNNKPTNSRGHTIWSKDDRNQLMEEYKKSGKTKKAFCLERGINIGTFYGWIKAVKVRRGKSKREKRTFEEIRIPVAALFPVEIVLPGGSRVCLRNTDVREEMIDAYPQAHCSAIY